ncbi:MAG TPA: oligoendopeptidase F [Clostridiales bacterium UBA8960]|nr:oligoendopeptidase F [Clostridiales bacterium UBA8960]
MTHTPNKIMHRSDVPSEMTWSLDDLFTSRQDWNEQVKISEAEFDALASYQGHLSESPEILFECLSKLESAYIRLIQISTYAILKQSEDATDMRNQEDAMLFDTLATKASSNISFIASEITALDEQDYHDLFEKSPELRVFKNYLDEMYIQKPHKLSPETEVALANLSEVIGAPYRIYQVSKAADMLIDPFQIEDETFSNSFALYETKYEYSHDHAVRREAYKSFSRSLSRYKNTYASVYATEVKKQVALSKLRKYASVTEMLLEPHKVSPEMYHRQIDIIYNKLAPHMRRFAQIKKAWLGLDQIAFYDLKAPLDHEFDPPADYKTIRNTIVDAMGILGEDYTAIMHRAFDERWIDYSDNLGKATGAFCASPYGVHSYILISYQESMRSAFTLAHELGHAGHFTFANKHQRIFDTRPSTYFVEAPSTMNEILLAKHLMNHAETPRMKRWVILQLLGTYYHNFVTHLLEAEFQRRVYEKAESGGSLTSKFLCDTKLDCLRTFWGDSVHIDEDAGLTWMRQPHYYMGLYPYTYSAGLTASTAIAQQIFEEGEPAVERWLDALKAGGSHAPEALMKMAGIDMSTPEPIEKAVMYVGQLIDELETLFKA